MDQNAKAELDGAVQAIQTMIARSEKAQMKFAPGTSHHTLQKNRIKALAIASALLKAEQAGQDAPLAYTKEELRQAAAPLASLISKSEKARQKLSPGTWQRNMLDENLRALHLAAPLLANRTGAQEK